MQAHRRTGELVLTSDDLRGMCSQDALRLIKKIKAEIFDSTNRIESVEVVIDEDGWPLHSRKKSCDKSNSDSCDDSCDCDECRRRKYRCGGTGISSGDINRHRAGYMINEPGEYTLVEDVSFNPRGPGAAAIVINADNVTLHLCNKVLRQMPGNSKGNTVGILINGRNNISIDGGTIRDFTLFGIVGNPNNDVLFLRNLKVLNCGTQRVGVFLGGVQLALSNNIQVESCSFVGNIGVGVAIFGCNNFSMSQSACDDTKGVDFGIGPEFTRAVAFGAFPFPPIGGPTVSGSQNIKLLNSTFSRTTATMGVFGALIISFNSVDDMKNILIENCVSMGNRGGAVSDEIEGFGCVGTNITVRNCVADDVTAPNTISPFGGLSRGFRAIGSNILYKDCVASNITGSGPSDAIGFSAEYSNRNVMWQGCKAFNILNTGTPSLLGNADAYGFGSVTRGSIFVEIFFAGPIFNFQPGLSNSWLACSSQNVIAIGGGLGAAFGIASQRSADIQKCIASDSNHFGLRFSNVPDNQGNLLLSSNAIVKGNTIYNNSAGIRDDTTGNNTYITNIARSNGAPGNNYVGVPAGTPIRIWTLPGPPDPVDNNGILDPLDNMDIRP